MAVTVKDTRSGMVVVVVGGGGVAGYLEISSKPIQIGRGIGKGRNCS